MATSDFSGPAQTNDPAFGTTDDDGLRQSALYNGLVSLDSGFQPHPDLAETWESNEERTEWTFHLRQGVKFSDGSDFDATDAVFTYQRLLDPDVASPAASVLGFLDPQGIEAVNPYTVRFTTEAPVAELPVEIANHWTYIVPKDADPEVLKMRGIGTGPFVMEEFEPNTLVARMVKNPNYWEKGLPLVDCLEEHIIQEATTRMAALQAGEVDMDVKVQRGLVSMLEKDPNLRIVKSAPATSYGMPMMVDVPPFDNPLVRQAMKLVADRELLLNTVALGYGGVGNDNPVPPTYPNAFSKEVPKQDIKRAKQLLADAGYPNGIDLELYTSDVLPGFVELAQAYKEMAAPAGIRVNVIQAPPETYWDEVWLKKPWVVSGWAAATVPTLLRQCCYSTGEWNDTHWRREDFDDLLDEAGATIDDAARTALYNDAQRMLADEGGMLTTIFVSEIAAIRSNVDGYTPHIQSNNFDWRNVHLTD